MLSQYAPLQNSIPLDEKTPRKESSAYLETREDTSVSDFDDDKRDKS